MMQKKVRKTLPYRPGKVVGITEKAKYIIQKIANSFGYEIHRISGIDTTLIPPYHIRSIVGPVANPDYYIFLGEQFFSYFKYLCGLKPNEDILDVGCGYGRMAVTLAKYLNKNATYEGFDVIPILIDWCRTNISSKYPSFHFQLVDVFNESFNPKGQFQASEYRFPYKDESFDFIFLLSVFTHMRPQDLENYLSEISRVLRKGQRCLITYFLLNTQSLAFIDAKLSTLDFNYIFGNYRSVSQITPEDAVAYDEDYVLHLYEKYGLKIVNPIHYGSWCGRMEYLSYQDIIIAVKD
jgi:SAM-dependent methyltransferase